jgi:MFS family permease
MAAALSIGNAVGIAVQGALIDRRGQTAVLVTASLACLSAFVGLVLVTDCGGPPALSAGLAVAGGAAIPATPSSMRALWAGLVAEPGLRMTGYALSAVSFTAATVLGPVLVSGLLLGGPQAAVLAAAGLAAGVPPLGTRPGNRTAAPSRSARPGPAHADRRQPGHRPDGRTVRRGGPRGGDRPRDSRPGRGVRRGQRSRRPPGRPCLRRQAMAPSAGLAPDRGPVRGSRRRRLPGACHREHPRAAAGDAGQRRGRRGPGDHDERAAR